MRRAAPAVDALVVVAHRSEHAFVGPTSSLSSSYCTALVSWYSSTSTWRSCLPLGARLLVALQQLQRQADQVVEVHRLVGRQALLVQLHHPRGHLLVVVLGGGFGLALAWPMVLPQADGPLPAAGQLGSVVPPASRIRLVTSSLSRMENCGFRPSRAPSSRSSRTPREWKVEHTTRCLAAFEAHQRLGALAHLLRGLVGEGDRADLAGCIPTCSSRAILWVITRVLPDPRPPAPGRGRTGGSPPPRIIGKPVPRRRRASRLVDDQPTAAW
jgi:hypothetical protein